jgi:hypothetical protein
MMGLTSRRARLFNNQKTTLHENSEEATQQFDRGGCVKSHMRLLFLYTAFVLVIVFMLCIY